MIMHNDLTGSIEIQCEKRLENLYRESHIWLLQVGYNICKHTTEAEELVSDLYVYLAKKCRPKIWYNTSYNLIYCMKFMKHRWINRVGKLNRYNHMESFNHLDKEFEEYNVEKDIQIMDAHNEVMKELDRLRVTKMWPAAKIYEIYWMSDDTLNEVANKIGISKSTTFLAIKKIKKHMKEVIDNPFK